MTKITLKRIPILTISDVMNQIRTTTPMRMVYYRGHILSPTLPSEKLQDIKRLATNLT